MTTALPTFYHEFLSSLGLREDPFHVSPDPRFYFSTRAQEAVFTEVLFALESRQGLMVLTGEAGTGKTTIVNRLLNWLRQEGRSCAYVFHPLLEPVELFEFILNDFEVPFATRSKGDLLAALHQWLIARREAGDAPVLIIDEAQVLSAATLDELRLLLNLEMPGGKLLQIVLVGQPELDDKLRQRELRQLRQRVMFRCKLPLFTLEETAAYIRSRLASAGHPEAILFPEESVKAIYASSGGIPRVINVLCEHALIAAYAGKQPQVSPESVRRIAAEFELPADGPLHAPTQESREHALPFGQLIAFPAAPISASAIFPLAEPERPEKTVPLLTAVAAQVELPKEPRPVTRTEPRLVVEHRVSLAPAPALRQTAPAPDAVRNGRPALRKTSYWQEVTESFTRDYRIFHADASAYFSRVLAGYRRASQR
jgi:general secretion pathway protein A